MVQKEAVLTDKAPLPLPIFSQAIKCGPMVYCSGSVGMNPTANTLIEGEVGARAEQCLKNLSVILEEAGSSLDKVVKVNIFLTNMESFAPVNMVYEKYFNKEPKPCRTCVAVFQLPLSTDVEIECVAHLYFIVWHPITESTHMDFDYKARGHTR
ncbi:YjgF-like protein [Trichoderma sp. SZMC 28015]